MTRGGTLVTCNCGNEPKKGDHYCRSCGAELEPSDCFLCECGAEVMLQDNFCHACGARFDGVEDLVPEQDEDLDPQAFDQSCTTCGSNPHASHDDDAHTILENQASNTLR